MYGNITVVMWKNCLYLGMPCCKIKYYFFLNFYAFVVFPIDREICLLNYPHEKKYNIILSISTAKKPIHGFLFMYYVHNCSVFSVKFWNCLMFIIESRMNHMYIILYDTS